MLEDHCSALCTEWVAQVPLKGLKRSVRLLDDKSGDSREE